MLLLPRPTWASKTNSHGAVATVHPLATQAAVDMLRRGGNAVDAIVAAGLTLGVVDAHNSGIGGGCFILARLSNGTMVALDGRETAPQAAHRDMFLRQGRPAPDLSQLGALAAGVPGALAAYAWVATNHGRIPLRDQLLAAARIAEDGFPIDAQFAARLQESAADLRKFPSSREVFLGRDGAPLRQGDQLRQPDLARSYRAIAEHGIEWFYGGPFAAATAAWMRENEGLMTVEDFRRYRPLSRQPVRSIYRGHEIVGFPSPSSGGIHVAQILHMLEQFDLRAMKAGSADLIHVTAEAMKLAFADRAHWLGDADFVDVPAGLIDPAYGRSLGRRIDLRRATAVAGAGTPPGVDASKSRHTTHFSAADGDGNWVACTATINTSFGAKVVVPGTGILLNNEMDDFSIQPGAVNYFGLVGAEANAVAAGKRPLSSMSPTVVLTNGRPLLSVGAAGGPTIISQTLLAIINTIDFQMPLAQALAAPRWHHQWKPDELRLEIGVGESVMAELQRRGHQVKAVRKMGAAQAVGRNAAAAFTAVHDPRNEGSSLAW
jgi:gamma-glutamyltranspeptidase/glutathione hydrolase